MPVCIWRGDERNARDVETTAMTQHRTRYTHLKKHHAQAPDIRIERVRQPRIDFWRHVLEGSRAAMFVRHTTWSHLDRKSEIDVFDNFSAASGRDQNIVLRSDKRSRLSHRSSLNYA